MLTDDIFERFFAAAADLLCVVDTEGCFRLANPAWERVLGWSAEELCSRPHLEFVHADDLGLAHWLLVLFSRGEPVRHLRFRYRHKDGGFRRLEWCAPVPEASGLIYASVRDITEVADPSGVDANHRSERLEQLLSSSPVTVYAADPNGWRLTFLSVNCLEVFGESSAKICASPQWWHCRIHADDREEVVDRRATWLATGSVGVFRCVYRICRAGGGVLWIEDSVRAIHGSDGELLEIVGVVVDISDRWRRDRALRDAKGRLEATLNAIPDVILELDMDGRFTGFHSSALDLLALPPERFLGKLMEEVMPPEVAALGRTVMRESLALGRTSGHRYSLNVPSGETRWFELSAALRAGACETDAPSGVVLVSRDITERHGAEIALRAAHDRAEQASTAKSRFLANMSHEIRTPMNGVLGMIEALGRVLHEPEQRRLLGVIRESSLSLLNIINDILDISKIEAGKLVIEHVAFLPAEIARKVRSLHTLRAADRGLDLEVRMRGYPNAARVGDPYRILQLLHNLVGNAIKFTEQGSVAVELDCTPNGPLEIEVRDTGIGMSSEQLDRLGSDFEQADTSITRRFGGTGLGIAIVRHLVVLMKGQLAFESELGCGTVVRVSLPLELAPAFLRPTRVQLPEPAHESLARLRVLAADDNEINRMVLVTMLESLKVSCTMVDSGRAAIATAESQQFDLLLLDISMPDIDGVETLRAIRARDAALGRLRTPALAVTAHAYAQEVEAYLAAGFDAHIAKPLRPDALRTALERLARLRE